MAGEESENTLLEAEMLDLVEVLLTNINVVASVNEGVTMAAVRGEKYTKDTFSCVPSVDLKQQEH